MVKPSPYCVLVSHCILAQTVRAEGCASAPASIREVVDFCLDNEINMIQMPCPETLFPSGGIGRESRGKKWYEKQGFREFCKPLADSQAAYCRTLTDGGKVILGIIGVEFSPACSTVNKNVFRQTGIFIECLRESFAGADLDIPMICVTPKYHRKMAAELKALLP